MPVTMTDGFDGALDTLVNGRVAGGAAWSCAGSLAGDINGLKLNGAGRAKNSSSSGCLGRIETGSTGHWAKASSWGRSTSVQIAVAVRAVDHRNFIGLRVVSATQAELFKRIAGSDTRIALLSAATAAPVTLELRIEAGVATPFVNGAQVGLSGGYAVADAVFDGVTLAGMWARGALDPAADDFECGTFGAAAAGLVPAPARLATRGGAAAVAWRGAIGPASARSAVRGGAARLSVVGGALVPARGRSAGRDRGAGLAAARAAIAPARGRMTMRGAAVALGGGGGVPVAGEARTVIVAGEPRVAVVPREAILRETM